jgi:cation transport ATPase
MRSTDLEHGHAEHAMHTSHGMPPKTSAGHVGHDRHSGHSVAMFRDKFWLTLILTLPVVGWSAEVQHWLGYTALTFPGSQYIPAFLGTIAFFYGGSVFIRGAWGELADRRPGMMTLISLGIVVAFVASLAATFGFFAIETRHRVRQILARCFFRFRNFADAVAAKRRCYRASHQFGPNRRLNSSKNH